MKVRYISPDGRKSYDLKIGWSWTLFLFWSTFGIPFWCRGMTKYAVLATAWTVMSLVVSALDQTGGAIMSVAQLGAAIALGRNGNEMTEADLKARGWRQETAQEYKARTGRDPMFVAG